MSKAVYETLKSAVGRAVDDAGTDLGRASDELENVEQAFEKYDAQVESLLDEVVFLCGESPTGELADIKRIVNRFMGWD